jgi:hypothetical protein
MNDQFLTDFQRPPRQEFTESLYRKLNIPENNRSFQLRRLAVGFSLAVLLFVLTFLISPAARSYAQELILRLGRLVLSSEPTYAEQYENKISSGLPKATAEPVPVEWQAPSLLTLDEASAQAGFPVSEITALPDDMMIIARFVSLPEAGNPFTRVTTTRQSGATTLAFSQTAYEPDAESQLLPVGESLVAPVTVQGVEGLWIENLRLSTYVDENNRVAPQFASLLVWEKDGFEYGLQSTPGLPLDEMLVLANSVKP